MTTTAIKWLVYDDIRSGQAQDELSEELQRRGATYDDLVNYIVQMTQGSN